VASKHLERIEIGGEIYCFKDPVVQEFLNEVKPLPLFEGWIRKRIKSSVIERRYYFLNSTTRRQRSVIRRINDKERMNEKARDYYWANVEHMRALSRHFRARNPVPLVMQPSSYSPMKRTICRD
jgi:hypothetical protein